MTSIGNLFPCSKAARLSALGILVLALKLVTTSSLMASEPVGQFCPHCSDQASAQQLAESMAPPPASGPGCDDLIPPGGSGLELSEEELSVLNDCPQIVRRVFIINHLTGISYAFDVWTEVTLPVALPVVMSPVEQLVSDRIVELRLAWEDLMQGSVVNSQDVPALAFGGDRLLHPSLLSDPDCPQGTALDAYLSLPAMEDLRELLIVSVAASIPPFDEGQSSVRRLTGVSAQAYGFGLSAQWEPISGNVTRYEYVFNVSEHPQPLLPDRLVFDMEYLADGPPGGTPYLDVEFNRSQSRVAGRSLLALESGGEVSTECATAKLEQSLTDRGFTFHIPPGDPNPSPFPEFIGASGGDFTICSKTLLASVGGEAQYIFTILVPCDQQ